MREYDRLSVAGQQDSAASALDRAARLAPGDIDIQAFIINELWARYGGRAVRDRYRTWDAGDPGLSACIRTATDLPTHPLTDAVASDSVLARLRAMEGSPAGRRCATRFIALLETRTVNWRGPGRETVAALQQIAAEPSIVPVYSITLMRAMRRHAPRELVGLCAQQRHLVRFAAQRLEWELGCIYGQLAQGDTVRARAAFRALDDAVRRDGRPGLRLLFGESVPLELQVIVDGVERHDEMLAESIEIAVRMGDWWQEYSLRANLARRRIDRGDPTTAVVQLDQAVRLAERHGTARDRGRALVWRGRARSRLGHIEPALADLRRAIPILRDSADSYDLAEAWHNLAHVYERASRWSEAAAAVDRFAAITANFRWDGTRAIARRDASEIKRKAGWIAAADEDAAALVEIIRDQDQNHQWAGEYHERKGELRAALEMYRLGVDRGVTTDPLDVAGMTRMYLALGRYDSAAVSARRHDAMRSDWRPGEVPLLPDILAAQGEVGAAARLLGDWAATRLRGADQHGAALAHLAWGRMALRARDLTSAERAAVVADSLGRRAASPNDAAAARLLRARVLSLRGARSEAIALARAAANDAALREFPLLRIEAMVTVGDVAAGVWSEAARTAVYSDAAALVDEVSVGLSDDRDRAGYRARQLAPFDSALSISARGPPNTAAAAEWASRRKAAALRLAIGGDRAPALPSLELLRRRLGAGAVFVDFSILADETVILVMTAERARTVRVPAGAAVVDSLVLRARRGMDAVSRGRVDVARIRIDTTALRRLSDALLAPIADELRRATRLLVSADGALQSFPIEMLPMPATSDRLVLDAFPVRYLPGAWAIGAPPPPSRGPVLVVGQPAPGAIEELQAVQAAWSGRTVRTLDGALATEEALESQRRGVGVLHLLAHAIADPIETDASHLRLARSETNDGFLHVREVSAWRGAPALVVLSACATASGATLLGEGPFSLTRAFLRAGSREVIATQWPVGAVAARFSDVLHRELARGRSAEDAVAIARRALRADPATSHPFYWAPFILVANDAP